MPENETMEMLGELRVLQRLSDYEFGVEVEILRSGVNRNKWDYQNVDKYYKSFLGTPILIAYTHGGSRVGDGHNMEIRRDPKTGETYYSFTSGTAERIVGTLSEDPEDIWLEERDGQTWIIAKGRIFAFYAKELVDKIIETGTMSVSAETEVHEEHRDEQGVDVFTDWTGIGVTILGDGVAPAVPGANIAALAAMQEEFAELKLRAASLRENGETDIEEPENAGTTAGGSAPKNNNSDKGVNKKMQTFNKTQCAALADKFTGWIVVCAAKDDEGKIHVGLRNNGWEFGRYTMESETETFAPERVEKIAVNADFGGGLTSDVCDMVDGLNAELKANAASLETTTAQLDAANETIKTLREQENAHRTDAAKRAAKETLAAFNANRTERVEESVLDAVNADIDNGLYANSADADGNWTGEAEVRKTVKALCADAVLAQDRANAEKSRRSFIWEESRNNSEADDGTLASMLREYDTENK